VKITLEIFDNPLRIVDRYIVFRIHEYRYKSLTGEFFYLVTTCPVSGNNPGDIIDPELAKFTPDQGTVVAFLKLIQLEHE
jgi:hypothetical protein